VASLDKLKSKNAPQVSIALMRMKPMSRKEAMNDAMSEDGSEYDTTENNAEEEMGKEDMMEDKAEYGSEHCPKCAEYQMLIGEALAMYMKNKDAKETPDSEME
jgi:HD-GYP domain-containing protein (c-di-GMP phosphodiesterase class II)